MKAGTLGSWIRLAVFGAIAVWTLFLFIISKDVLRVETNSKLFRYSIRDPSFKGHLQNALLIFKDYLQILREALCN